MGNWNFKEEDRRTACQNLDYARPKINTSAISVTIKTMPQYPQINLTQIQNCIERKMESTLYDGQKMEITLRTCPHNYKKKCSSINQMFNFSLRCEIQNKSKYYAISFPSEKQRNLIWKFVRGWTQLEEQDMIKLGNTQYKLYKLVLASNQASLEQNPDCNLSQSSSCQSSQQCSKSCRICFSSKQTSQNPFITPCRCMGSLQYSHLKCLSKWVFSLNINEDTYISIKINKFICQLCKTDITSTPQYKLMKNELFSNMNNISPPYAILQNLYVCQKKKTSNYFILSFQKKLLYSIGRSNQADIVDKNDKCISKIHSQIQFINNQLMVRDCQSLHGTMMSFNGPLKLNQDNLNEDVIFRNMLIKATYVPQQNSQN